MPDTVDDGNIPEAADHAAEARRASEAARLAREEKAKADEAWRKVTEQITLLRGHAAAHADAAKGYADEAERLLLAAGAKHGRSAEEVDTARKIEPRRRPAFAIPGRVLKGLRGFD